MSDLLVVVRTAGALKSFVQDSAASVLADIELKAASEAMKKADIATNPREPISVSYTHLTLPTILLV